MPKRPARKVVKGADVLYHYLQKSLQDEDVWLFQMLVAKLVTALGIWFPPSGYGVLPIALPHVVRDPDCRGLGPKDQWSSPNAHGYVRDDNSLVKGLVGSFSVKSPNFSEYRNRKLGGGFVSAHAWRTTSDGGYAARQAPTNSFWPNLVWLPTNVAKLTDREGSFAQTFVQALSTKIYRDAEVSAPLRSFADEAWALLPEVPEFPEQGLPDTADLNFFEVPTSFFQTRLKTIRIASAGLRCVEEGRPLQGKVLHTRYTAGLVNVEPEAARLLRLRLDKYADGVEGAIGDLSNGSAGESGS